MVKEISWTEQERGDGLADNDEFDVASASDVTVYIKASGTDTATARYFGLGRAAKSLVLSPAATISIKSINNTTLKRPRTVVIDTNFTITKGLRIEKFVISTETEPTNVKVYVQ